MIPYFTANQGKQLEEKVKTVEGVGSRVTALEEKVGDKLDNVSRIDDVGVFFNEDTFFAEEVAVDGDLTVNGEAIYFKDTTLGVDESRVCSVEYIPGTDEWKYVSGAYTSDTVLATGVTADSIIESSWEESAGLPMEGEDGTIVYGAGYGVVVLFLGNKKYFGGNSSHKLKLQVDSYTVVKADYPGYTEGEVSEAYHPLGYVETVHKSIDIDAGSPGVYIQTIAEDALYLIHINCTEAGLNLGSGQLLAVGSHSMGTWFYPIESTPEGDLPDTSIYAMTIMCTNNPSGDTFDYWKILK